MPDRTFGIELEYTANVESLAAHMKQKRLTYDGRLHRYHCDCAGCALNSGFPFHFQTDSTCGGECISRVFNSVDEIRPLLAEIEDSAWRTDAEPGMTTGMHVHVHPGRMGDARLSKAFLAFLLWEPTFMVLASGRFERQRPTQNSPVGLQLANYYYQSGMIARPVEPANSHPITRRLHYLPVLQMAENNSEAAMEIHAGQDRHTNLSLRTRYNTWEHRWPNSTRAAWRMEMYVRVCLGLFESEVVSAMLSGRVVDQTEMTPLELVENFANVLGNHDLRGAELVMRQRDYMAEIAQAPPPAALAMAN